VFSKLSSDYKILSLRVTNSIKMPLIHNFAALAGILNFDGAVPEDGSADVKLARCVGSAETFAV
jgi:hypothetical protein